MKICSWDKLQKIISYKVINLALWGLDKSAFFLYYKEERFLELTNWQHGRPLPARSYLFAQKRQGLMTTRGVAKG